MVNFYTTAQNHTLEKIENPQTDCWISMVAPTDGELQEVSKKYNIDMDSLKAALDTDERSRIEIDDNFTMVLVNIPTVVDEDETELYDTIPLSIITTKEIAITVCLEETPIIKQFAEGKVRDFYTNMKSRFILQLLYRSSSLYLQYLRIIDRKSDAVENKLHKS
ncbi:MAG: magnesium transporter CorA family protein, partial [Oscillospiraceae bacterium]